MQISYKCGHTVDTDKDLSQRQLSRWKYIAEHSSCPECNKAANNIPVRMPYTEYKRKYNNCKTMTNSYDDADKTVVVYLFENEVPAADKTPVSLKKAIKELIELGADETAAQCIQAFPMSYFKKRLENSDTQSAGNLKVIVDYLRTHYITMYHGEIKAPDTKPKRTPVRPPKEPDRQKKLSRKEKEKLFLKNQTSIFDF